MRLNSIMLTLTFACTSERQNARLRGRANVLLTIQRIIYQQIATVVTIVLKGQVLSTSRLEQGMARGKRKMTTLPPKFRASNSSNERPPMMSTKYSNTESQYFLIMHLDLINLKNWSGPQNFLVRKYGSCFRCQSVGKVIFELYFTQPKLNKS